MKTPELLTDEEAYPPVAGLSATTQVILSFEKNGMIGLNSEEVAELEEHFKKMGMKIIDGQVVPAK